MSTAGQTQRTTSRDVSYGAAVLAVALLPLIWLQPTAGCAEPAASFLAGTIETENGTKRVIEGLEPPATSVQQTTGLFGMETQLLTQGEILDKWNQARAEIARELQILDRCRMTDVCPAAARRLIDLSSEGAGRNGRARLGLLNRAIDLAITPASDERQWRVPDYWSTPFETLQSGRGDCEDYAILKYLALLDAGISSADLKIVLMRNVFPKEDHAVVAARVGGEWLILDNRTLTLVRDTNLTRAVPLFVLDEVGVRRFVSGSRARRT